MPRPPCIGLSEELQHSADSVDHVNIRTNLSWESRRVRREKTADQCFGFEILEILLSANWLMRSPIWIPIPVTIVLPKMTQFKYDVLILSLKFWDFRNTFYRDMNCFLLKILYFRFFKFYLKWERLLKPLLRLV